MDNHETKLTNFLSFYCWILGGFLQTGHTLFLFIYLFIIIIFFLLLKVFESQYKDTRVSKCFEPRNLRKAPNKLQLPERCEEKQLSPLLGPKGV